MAIERTPGRPFPSRGLTRRALLAGLGASVLPLSAAGADAPLYLACCRLADGQMAAAVVDAAGTILLTEILEARGHGAAVSPDRSTAVVFARRPGRFAVVLDLVRRQRTQAFAPPADRRFAGHGAFSADGGLLYAAENDFEAERGVIGIYDRRARYRRLGEFETGGTGPHELLLLSDGVTLAVANGGIATHPDYPRMKLNLPTMRPSMALVDARDGRLIAKAELPAAYHQLSIRHMAEVSGGVLWFGAQHEGAGTDEIPLVGTYDPAAGLSLMADAAPFRGLRQYIGSVAASRDGATVITTAPRGGIALEWDVGTRRLRRTHRLRDVCGAAPSGASGVMLTTGTGRVLRAGGTGGQSPCAWDNHLTAL